ncbi:hypothetical protein Csa_009148 [Cucumis sativus]|nr:hypothetical protein Csa_009148 [Cucumis sativus]
MRQTFLRLEIRRKKFEEGVEAVIDFPAFFNHNHFLRFSSINSTSSQSFASNSLVPALFVIHDSGPIIFPTVEISTPVLPLEGSVMEEFPSIFLYRDENAACTEDINDMVIEFNFSMRYTVKELGTELHHSSIILCDLLRVSMDILKDHICVLQGSMD